jgi:hypothetical protein
MLDTEPIESMEKAEDIVNYTIATKMLDDYITNFPNVRNPNQ